MLLPQNLIKLDGNKNKTVIRQQGEKTFLQGLPNAALAHLAEVGAFMNCSPYFTRQDVDTERG